MQGGRDADDLVEWLAAQPFSDDRVGMFGESFGGQTSYGAAIERPAHLVAIAPLQSPSSLYHDVVFPGGVKSTERGEIDNWPDIANLTSDGVIDADAEFAGNRATPDVRRVWHDRSFVDGWIAGRFPCWRSAGGTTATSGPARSRTSKRSSPRTWRIYGSWRHFFPVALGARTWATPPTRNAGMLAVQSRSCRRACCWRGSTTG